MRVEPELPDHPKYLRLKRRVGDFAMEALVRIWGHCQQNKRGGFWKGADAEYLEIIAKWADGEPGLLFRALADTGWIELREDGILVHDWDEMNSLFVKNWAKGALGGRPAKGHKHEENNPVVNPTETPGLTSGETRNGNGFPAISGDAQNNPVVNPNLIRVTQTETNHEPTAPNLTLPNQTKPKGVQGEMRGDLAQEVIGFLNERTGATFAGTPFELTLAATCLARVGNDVAGVKQMIARQTVLWRDVPRLRNCLRPQTLFDPEKFDSYYAQRALPAESGDPGERRRELEELIARSPANKKSVRHNPQASAAEREQLKIWRGELESLHQKTAVAS